MHFDQVINDHRSGKIQMANADSQEAVFAFLMAMPVNEDEQAGITRIDTHANVVLLVGSKAYKVKRSVKFPFLDYSTLAKRAEACQREISHNTRNAAQIYIEALPITCDADGHLAIDGPGETIEWVVVMNRFEQDRQLDHVAKDGPLSKDLCDDLADMLVSAHAAAPEKPEAAQGFFKELASYVDQNEVAFAEHPDLFPPQAAEHLTRQSRLWLERIEPLLMKRGADGHVRLCHGDAHMRNIVVLDGRPVLFDAIEFSDAMATTDTLYDLAFLLMDLWENDQRPAANLVFNRYFDKLPVDTRDGANELQGLAALPFYLMMRAAIRAKIAASAAKTQHNETDRRAQEEQAVSYFNQAIAFLDPVEPDMVAIGGFSGTGKTTLAYALAPEIGRAPGARVLRTDIERKKRLGLSETQKAPPEAYTRAATEAVYGALDTALQTTLASGHSALFDAVFADEKERARIEQLAKAVEARFCGLWLDAPAETLMERVSARQGDASDATTEVVDLQLSYDLGDMTWSVIDAGGEPTVTLKNAKEVIGETLPQNP